MPSPTETPDVPVDAVTFVDGSTLVVALLTLVATVVFAIIDAVLRRSLAALADFHERYVVASKKAISTNGAEQLQGVRELDALVKSPWAKQADQELALRVMEDLDRD